MRIAMVGHKRVPSREGGIEVVVEELAARMVVHGHAVTCYNRSGHHVSGREYDAEHLDEYRGIRLRHLPTIDRKGLAAVTSSFFGCPLRRLSAPMTWSMSTRKALPCSPGSPA